MVISAMKEKVIIEKNMLVIDEDCNHLNQWEPYYECWTNAGASPYKQKESEKAGVVVDTNAMVFSVRYCSELADLDTTHYRVRFHDETYNITNIDTLNFNHKELQISCDRERKDLNVEPY